MNDKKIKILVSNDDGYNAKGFTTVCRLASQYGEVVGVAPKYAQSGKSAALTMGEALWLQKECEFEGENGNPITLYSFTGTPVDCVKIAMNTIFSIEDKPDFMISGINHGSNASAAAIYSGTLGAAKEGTLYGIPSIALSIDTHVEDADFSAVEKYFSTIMENFLKFPPRSGTYLNVNFPYIPIDKIKGIRFAKQGDGMWVKEFDVFQNKRSQTFYIMSGEFLDLDTNGAGDHTVMAMGYISVCPQQIDSTDYKDFERLTNNWKFD